MSIATKVSTQTNVITDIYISHFSRMVVQRQLQDFWNTCTETCEITPLIWRYETQKIDHVIDLKIRKTVGVHMEMQKIHWKTK